MAWGLSLPPAHCWAIRCGLPCASSSRARGTWGATWVAEVIQFTRAPPSSTTFTGFVAAGERDGGGDRMGFEVADEPVEGGRQVRIAPLHAGCSAQALNRPSKPCRALLQVRADPALDGGRMPSMPTERSPSGCRRM